MESIDFLILLGFVVYAVWQGLRSVGVASSNLEEYFLAGRTLSGWKAGISMAATQFAADTPLLVTGLVATAGVFSLWRLWIYAISFLLLGLVLGRAWRRAGVLTDAELTEIRYGDRSAAWLRGFKALYFGTFFNCIALAWVLLATTRIAEPFLHWDRWLPAALFAPVVSLVEWVGTPLTASPGGDVWMLSANNLISVVVIVLVTTFYSTTGGLRGVVNTDLVQFLVMMVATIGFMGAILVEVGGLGGLADGLRERFAGGELGMSPSELLAFTPSQAEDAGLALLMVFGLQWLLHPGSDGSGYLAQRTMACKDEVEARRAAVVFTGAQVFLRSLLWLPIALGLLLVFPPDASLSHDAFLAKREATYVQGIAELLPVGLKGLMVTAMLAALASTVDTHLNLGSSYWTNDLYRRFVCQKLLRRDPSPRGLVWVARISNILILLLALTIMSQLGSIKQAWEASLLLGSGVGVALLLRWLWWRMTAWGELSCILVSLALSPVLMLYLGDVDTYVRLLIMAGAGTLAAVGVSYFTTPNHQSLVAFYERVRPPGWWRPVAEVAETGGEEDGVARFWRAAAATALASLSVFCLLTGIGSLLIDSPAPTWMPWRNAWLTLLIGVGAVLIPIWWRWGGLSRARRR